MSDACAVCGKLTDHNDTSSIQWINCSVCQRWFHAACIGLHISQLDRIREYHCAECAKHNGPSVMTRVSARRHKRIDYVALNDGEDVRELNHHPHINEFVQFTNDRPLSELVYLVDPSRDSNSNGMVDDACLRDIIMRTQLKRPILVRGANPFVKSTHDSRIQLTMKFPYFTIDQLSDLIGPDTPVPVMDVLTQGIAPKWTMEEWKDYYKQDPEDRDRIRNVISLEFSQKSLGPKVELPKVVTDIDIVTRIFQSDLDVKFGIERPKVTKYVLMSVANSFTDFHIDFAGTSVYYTILSGKKQFLMYPPTAKNLSAYEKWCDSDDQSSLWFGDLVSPLSPKEVVKYKESGVDPSYINNGIKVDIEAGDLLLLPSGWIHSVYTPADSLILGGNFLNLLSLENHLKTYQIEVNTKVPEKFRFPDFLRIVWLIGWYLKENDPELTSQELDCISGLEDFYESQWQMVNDKEKQADKKTRKVVSHVRRCIPHSTIGDVDKFIRDFHKWYGLRVRPKKRRKVKMEC